jgi:hypothetical protein
MCKTMNAVMNRIMSPANGSARKVMSCLLVLPLLRSEEPEIILIEPKNSLTAIADDMHMGRSVVVEIDHHAVCSTVVVRKLSRALEFFLQPMVVRPSECDSRGLQTI